MEKQEPKNLILTEQIKSSSADIFYTIKVYENCITCDCPAGGKRTICKHIIQVFKNNEEQIKEKAPNLHAGIIKILELKQTPNYSKDKLKELSMLYIFSNKEISEKAHQNSEIIKSYSEQEFNLIIEKIQNMYSKEQIVFLMELLSKSRNFLDKLTNYFKGQ